MNNKNIISPRGRDFLLYRRKKRYAELTGISNCKSTRIKSLVDNKLIGRFSCLSVADIANITSLYNGKAYYYVMNKDVDQLHIDLLFEKDTDEHNGVEVKVPVKNFDSDALDCLSFIENLYVEAEDENIFRVSEFNKRKIRTYKTFKLVDYSHRPSIDKTQILLGRIPYVVDYNSLWDYNDSWHKSWKKSFEHVFPQIEIGKLDITPNREGLLYSERTKEVLRNAYDASIKELIELWNAKCNAQYEDIYEFMSKVYSHYFNILDIDGISVPISNDLPYNAHYKKYQEWDNFNAKDKKEYISCLLNTQIDVLCEMYDNTIHQSKRHQRWFTVNKLCNDWLKYDYKTVLALSSKAGFSSQYFKRYILDTYSSDNILIIRQLPTLTRSYIKYKLRTIFGITLFSNKEGMKFVMQLLKELLLYLKEKIVVTDIIGSPEYEKYKKDHAQPKNYVKRYTEKITFTIVSTYNGYSKKHTCILDEIIPYIKREYGKHRVVYAELDNPFVEAFKAMRYPHLIILSASKGNMKHLYNDLPSWVRPITELYSPDNRVLQKFAAMAYISNQPEIDKTFEAISSFPNIIYKKIKELRKYTEYRYVHAYGDVDASSIIAIVPPEKYDRKIMALYHETYKYLKIAKRLDSSKSSFRCADYYALLKAKKYRFNYNFYKDVKDYINNLLSLL